MFLGMGHAANGEHTRSSQKRRFWVAEFRIGTSTHSYRGLLSRRATVWVDNGPNFKASNKSFYYQQNSMSTTQ
jgi:hypothetical protein